MSILDIYDQLNSAIDLLESVEAHATLSEEDARQALAILRSLWHGGVTPITIRQHIDGIMKAEEQLGQLHRNATELREELTTLAKSIYSTGGNNA